MKRYEQQLQPLNESGMFYYGIHKKYCGKVQANAYFAVPGLVTNTFGYYQNDDGSWTVFVTDDERGTELKHRKFGTENDAVEALINLADSQNFSHYCNEIIEHLDEKEGIVKDYLMSEYSYSEAKAKRAFHYLLQDKYIAFEFIHYIEKHEFVPDKYAAKHSEYTAKLLSELDGLSILGAFNYMVYLKNNPSEALANLKKGLPRRTMLSDTELNEVQATMEEKTTAPIEENTEPQQSSTETPAELKELLEKLEAVQQALAGLQQSFDDKIAEDAHKNGLFDNMHRELTRYQNGALDKIVDTIALDIIQLVDSSKGHVRVYEKKEPTEENYKKLLRVVKGVTEDLEDILYRQSIESYRVEGHEVDVRRQKIIQTIPTDDKSKDNLVAVRVADGYEKDGKVLRPERIKIFKYEAASASKPTEK